MPDVQTGKPIWGGRGYCKLCRGPGEAFEVEAARPLDVEPARDEGPFGRFSRARRRGRRESDL